MNDTITIIQETDGNRLAKVITKSGNGIKVSDYDNAYLYDFTEAAVGSIHDVLDVVNMVSEFKSACLIKGVGIQCTNGRRTLENTVAVPHHWMMVDFDKVEMVGDYNEDTIAEAVIAKWLPAEFQDVSFIWQHSSKANLQGWNIVSGHAFFWLSRKWEDKELNAWAKNVNVKHAVPHPDYPKRFKDIVDPGLFHQVLPHYVATPIFRGMEDPVKQRIVFYKKGSDEVDLQYVAPAIVKYAAQVAYVAADDDLEQALALVKQYNPRPSFVDWRLIAFATARTCGDTLAATALLQKLWPEETKGEYKQMFKGFIDTAAPPFDMLIKWARKVDQTFLKDKANDDLKKRIAELKAKGVSEAEVAELEQVDEVFQFEEEENNLKWETRDTTYSYNYIEGECGEGKTEWMLDRIANNPGKYVIALPMIRLIREVMDRVEGKHGDLKSTVNYKFKTIYSKRSNTLRDDEESDAEDDSRNTVTYQLAEYKKIVDSSKWDNVVIFITHAALFQTDWSEWGDFELIVDEIPEVYINYTQNLTQNPTFIEKYIRTKGERKNYYRLGLTDEGAAKFEKDGNFDDIDGVFEGLMEAINNPNTKVYAQKNSWDDKDCEKVRFLRLIDPGFLQPFNSVCVMGDKFTESLMCLVWERTHNVKWGSHPDWKPAQKRLVPLNKRVKIHYFSDGDCANEAGRQRRASSGLFDDDVLNVLKKVKRWLESNVNGQRIITTNVKHQRLFEEEVTGYYDVLTDTGIERHHYTTSPQTAWIQPKVHGLNVYRNLRNVVWMAAMRPGNDEISFLTAALGITEEDIIRWREYNSMYQFVMRISLRKYDAQDICNVYVWDWHQVVYLQDRFNGALEVIKHNDITGIDIGKSGRPSNEKVGKAPAKTAAERMKEARLRKKEQVATAAEPAVPAGVARAVQAQTGESLASMLRRVSAKMNE